MASVENRRSRVTLQHVAREAGVSRATASLVVRKSPLVSAETREKVEQAMKSLGYVYNMGAARMRTVASRTVGVIVPNLSNPFFAEMLAGIELTLDTAGIVVIVANSQDLRERQDLLIQRMREHGVDGVILCPAAGTDSTLARQAAEWGLPLVQALRHVSETGGDYAGVDYMGGMRQAISYLAGLGHRRIAFVTGGSRHSAYAERLGGFRAGMAELGVTDPLVLEVALSPLGAIEAAGRLVAMADRPTAAICFNDVVGLGLSSGLHDLGLEVGREFSVIGFDDVAEASLVRPGLTSVATHPAEIGSAAARLLLDRLQNPGRDPRRVITPTELFERQSCGPCR